MGRGLLPCCLILVAAAAAAPASAGDPRVPSWRQSHLLEGDRAVNTLYRVATCLALRHPQEADALIAAPAGTNEEAEAFAALRETGRGCFRAVRRMTLYPRALLGRVPLMRGALAEAFVRTRDDEAPALPPRTAVPLPDPVAEDPHVLGRGVVGCAAAREPETAWELLRHNPGSPGEYRGLLRLGPAFESCLPDGRSLEMDRLTVRALLAEAVRDLIRSAPRDATTP